MAQAGPTLETRGNHRRVYGADLRIRINGVRNRCLEDSTAEARVTLSQRGAVKDDVDDMAACAHDITEFLQENALTERRAFLKCFVSWIVLMPGKGVIPHRVPMPDEVSLGGEDTSVTDDVLRFRPVFAYDTTSFATVAVRKRTQFSSKAIVSRIFDLISSLFKLPSEFPLGNPRRINSMNTS